MMKLKYLLTRIRKMDYKRFFETINYMHKKTKKSRLYLFFDIIYCGLKYQAGYLDYNLFEMYDLNKEQRNTIITRGINNEFVKKYNNPNYTKYFNNKVLFIKKFSNYIDRDWLLLDDNYEAFDKLLKSHKELIAKPINLQCGKGIIKVKDGNNLETYNELTKNGQLLVEEILTQCDTIKKLHPSSINTLRVVTINHKVVTAYIQIGNNNNIVDNFNNEGMVAPINIKTGLIEFPAIDKFDNLYYDHPLTHEKIVGLTIPRWGEVVKLCEEATNVIPEVNYVGWDVCVGPKKLYLIEGNEFPRHDIYQLPPHRKDGIGLLPVFKEAMKGIKNENIHK